jgi:hypothetical protein
MLFGSLFDGLVPGLFCERDGALPTDQKWQLNAAKWVARHQLSVAQCYRPSPYPSGAEGVSRVESISDPLTPVFYCGS